MRTTELFCAAGGIMVARNPFHPFGTFIVIPLTTLAFLLFAGAPSQRKDVRPNN